MARQQEREGELGSWGSSYLVKYGVFGALNGYFLLHPAAMAIFRVLHAGHDTVVVGTFVERFGNAVGASFHVSMLPMAAAFSILGGAISLGYGWKNRIIGKQRDSLRLQVARNDALIGELERSAREQQWQNTRLMQLQEHKERTTHFLVHDFKTHLGCIEGFSKLLLKKDVVRADAGIHGVLTRVQRQARLMLGAVRNLLDIARLDTVAETRRVAVSPHDVFSSVADDVVFEASSCRVRVSPSTRQCPPVSADPDLLRRVVVNLVSNAIKHNGADVTVELSANLAPAEGWVRLCCEDDGVGIEPARLDGLFEPYLIGDDAPADSTGLGLAFVRAAVEAHDGRVWCDSSPGERTRFFVDLPVNGAMGMTNAHAEPKRVLIVDDDHDFAAFLEATVRGLGYDAEVAFDADAALELAKTAMPDAITLDLHMPVKAGLQLFRQMCRDERLRDVPVVIVTGWTRSSPDARELMEALLAVDGPPGPAAFLEKPVARQELKTVLERVTAQTTGDDTARA